MTYDNANDLFDTLSESTQRPQVGEVMQLAILYARARVDHLIAAPETQNELAAKRSAVHNALIAACDALAAAMAAAHEDTLWRETLGTDRKDIGDFACFVHCRLGIEAR